MYTNRDKTDNNQIIVRKEVVIAESEKPKPEMIENKTVQEKVPEVKEKPFKYAMVKVDAANIRGGADLLSPRVGMIFEGEVVKVVDETADPDGRKWYKFYFYGDREAWISEKVITLK